MADFVMHAASCTRNRKSSCSACFHACPQGALSPGPDGPVHNASRCMGCGICATVCPISVFVPHRDNRFLACWLPELTERPGLALVCAASRAQRLPTSKDASNSLRLTGCPAALLPATLAACMASGIAGLDILHGDCSACGMGSMAALDRMCSLWLYIARGNAVLHEQAASGPSDGNIHDVHKPRISRRSLFRLSFAAISPPRFDPLPRLDTAMWREKDHPNLRRLFRDILREAPASARADAAVPESMQGFAVRVDSRRCTACGACARGCAGKALAISQESGGHVTFIAGRCIGCGVCKRVCPAKAISLTAASISFRKWLGDEPVTLIRAERKLCACKRCRASFTPEAPDETYCRICKKRLGLL